MKHQKKTQAIIICKADGTVQKVTADRRHVITTLGRWPSLAEAERVARDWRDRWLRGRRHYATEKDLPIEVES